MPEDTPQAEQVPATETQDPAVPTGEQITPEVADEAKQDGLPNEASERTKHEFEKLRNDLREERQRRESLESAYRSMQPKQPSQTLTPIVDPDTGYLNEAALQERDRLLQQANERATKAEQSVQQYVNDLENRRAYEAHPQLNPDSKQFDKELHRQARSVLLDSMVNPQDYGNKQLSLKDAGDFLKKATTPEVEAARQEGARQAIEQLSPKEQAALEATGASGRRTEVATNLESLRFQTRKGSMDATMARLEALKPKT